MSLRARMLSLVLAATLLPLLLVLWMLLEARTTSEARARVALVDEVVRIASDLDGRVSGTVQLLFGLGQVPLIASPTRPVCSRFLADVLKVYPQYTALLAVLPSGQLYCDSLKSGRRLDLTDQSYFQRATQSGRYVVEPTLGPMSGKGVLQIAHPVRDEVGALKYVMMAALNMDEFGRTVAASLPYANMNFQIWNDDASMVMDHPGSGAAKLIPGPSEKAFVLAADGSQMGMFGSAEASRLWATAPLPSVPGDMRLVLSVPVANLAEHEEVQFWRAMAWLLTFSALILTAAVAWGNFALRRPAARLIDAISRLDRGNFKEPVGKPYPKGELGGVMQAVDRMAVSLEQQRMAIERNIEALEHQASTDALTGLANRNLLSDRLEQALIYAHRANRVAGVIVLDLDRFKAVNDSLGHSQGDVLLQIVAKRLTACVREGDTAARLGGDEFILVLSDMAHVQDLLSVAQEVLKALNQPVHLAGQTLTVGASLGLSSYPRDGDRAEVLIRHADTAMYRAKEQGGNTLAFFTPEMDQSMAERLRMEAGLRLALKHDELRVYFQPIVNLASGRITSAEALVRWSDPERGLVLPGQFIVVAEETGLILPMGKWVLQEACRQAKRWLDLGLGSIPVAVNLSARQFSASVLDTDIQSALDAANCPAELLQLEITEGVVIANAEQALQTMRRLDAMGVELAIDDFGTGYSSLSYLKRFPVRKLKIDRSFVNDIHVDNNDKAIVDAILTMAHKLGLRTVAEGVETLEQLQYLKAQGCDEGQGYLFAKPCPADEFVRLLTADYREIDREK